jgi:hypothetical protein
MGTPAKYPPRIKVWHSGDARWRWHCQSRNGRIIGASEQGHRRLATAIRKARRQFPNATPIIVEPPS